MVKKIICPECGNENAPGSKFCNNCGVCLAYDPALSEQPPVKCVICGAENISVGRLCADCGAKLDVKIRGRVCPICKTENSFSDESCSGCGVSLSVNVKDREPAFRNSKSGGPLPSRVRLLERERSSREAAAEMARIAAATAAPAFTAAAGGTSLAESASRSADGTPESVSEVYTAIPLTQNTVREGAEKNAPTMTAIAANISNKSFLKSALMLLLSITLFIFAFMPMIKYTAPKTVINVRDGLDIRFSATDFMTYFFDSFGDYSSKEIGRTDLYEEYKMLASIVKEIGERSGENKTIILTDAERDTVRDYFILAYRLSLISAETETTASLTVAAIVSILYLVFSSACLALSLISLISLLLGKVGTASWRAERLFMLSPFAILITYLALSAVSISSAGLVVESVSTLSDIYNENVSYVVGVDFSVFDSGMAASVVSFIIALVGTLALVSVNLFEKLYKLDIKKVILRAVCAVCAFAASLMILPAAFSAELNGVLVDDASAEVDFDPLYFTGLELSDGELENIKGVFGDNKKNTRRQYLSALLNEQIGEYTATNVKAGKADSDVRQLITLTLYSWLRGGMTGFSFTYYLSFLAAVLLMVLAWRTLVHLTDKSAGLKLQTVLSALSLALSVAYLTVTSVFSATLNRAFSDAGLAPGITVGVAGGAVWMLIFSIVTVIASVASLIVSKRYY